MIVIAKLRQDTLESELRRRAITYKELFVAADGTIEFEVAEECRAKIRDWYANDDSILYFSSI